MTWPTWDGSSALDRDLYPKLFNNSMMRKSKLVSLLSVPNGSVDWRSASNWKPEGQCCTALAEFSLQVHKEPGLAGTGWLSFPIPLHTTLVCFFASECCLLGFIPYSILLSAFWNPKLGFDWHLILLVVSVPTSCGGMVALVWWCMAVQWTRVWHWYELM